MKVKLSNLSTWQKIQLLRRELRRECLEREYHIDALIALLISKQHGLLLGPPGTGKSMLIELLCESFSGKYFSMLVSENSKPDEFFGPVSIKALQDSEVYKRNTTDRLPDAEVVYLDEVFKTSSANLNPLLKIINERTFYNPDPTKVPLISLIGSSNELPTDEVLNAFVDRFVWKTWVTELKQRQNISSAWERGLSSYKPSINIRLSRQDLTDAGNYVKTVNIQHQFPLLLTLKEKLQDEGYAVSDRKWQQILRFMQAFAWVRNELEVSVDTIKLLLPDCLWNQPEDRQPITDKVIEIIDTAEARLKEIVADSKTLLEAFKIVEIDSKSISLDRWNEAAIHFVSKLEAHNTEIKNLEALGAPVKLCDKAINAINQALDEVKATIERVNNPSLTNEQRKELQEAITHSKYLRDRTLHTQASTIEWNESAFDVCKKIGNAIKRIEAGYNTSNSEVQDTVAVLKDCARSIREALTTVNNLN